MQKLFFVPLIILLSCNTPNSTEPDENNTNNTSNWTQTLFPSNLYGNWYTSNGIWNYYIYGSTTIRTGNKFYTLVTTYKNDNVYKAIATLDGQYYAFFFKDVTSSSMYAYKSNGYSTQSAAENASPGSYTYHYKN